MGTSKGDYRGETLQGDGKDPDDLTGLGQDGVDYVNREAMISTPEADVHRSVDTH